MSIKVEAGEVTETTTGVERGLDVGVTVTLPDGREIDGEVTLLPREDGSPGYAAWGSRDHWVSGDLLRALDEALSDDEVRDVLDEIESAASAACPR